MATHTVLVVDDEPASVRTIARALASECEVITAANGTQGLAALAARPVALMIVDQRMPEMSGTELLARSAAAHGDVIRVLLTGYTDVETLMDAINAGHVYHYLTKPWEPQALRLVVRRGLERFDTDAERRRLLGALEDVCARLRREADQKARLLAVAAHELGTPLHVLTNALALLSEVETCAAAAPWIETARRSGDWLARGLAQMATAARSRLGRLPLRCGAVDLRAVVLDLQRSYQPVCAARRLAWHLDMAAALPVLSADRIWLERALANLISNAVRFTPDGGHLTVRVACTATAVDLTVADTGVGIDASLLPEIFEPFSAAGGDLARHASGRFEFGVRGLGLGLAITKAIVEQHGGTIDVQSHPGTGSQFTLRLPVGDVKREA